MTRADSGVAGNCGSPRAADVTSESARSRRDAATVQATIDRLERTIVGLRKRLAAIGACQDKRCSLCLHCLNATYDED